MVGRVPAAVLDRRDKLGFAAPQGEWLDASRDDLADLLEGGQIVGRGWVEPGEVERLVRADTSSRRPAEQLWRLFITEAWLRWTWPDVRVRSDPVSWRQAVEVGSVPPALGDRTAA
jgi:hypothetical protein